jgi:tRNA G18 (ribose-2'-O)-methylase SpoU
MATRRPSDVEEPRRAHKPLRVTRKNDVFQEWLALKTNRSKRHRRGLFLIEGTTAIDRAVEHGWQIEELLYPGGRQLSEWARGHVESGVAQRTVEVEPALLGELCERHEGTELLAVARRRTASISALELAEPWLLLVMDRPKSPGNLGSIIRTAAAFDVSALVVTGHAADPFDPACVRASVGALFAMPLICLPSQGPLLDWVQARRPATRLTVIGTGQHGSDLLMDVALRDNLVIVLGNETLGLSQAYRDGCDRFVRLPTSARQSSLNVVSAASIVLYEVKRQRSGFELRADPEARPG